MSILFFFSHQVASNSSWPHGLQHTMFPYSSPSPRVYPGSCPLNRWCHPTMSSSVTLFSCFQSFPASGFLAFPIRWPEYWSFSFSISHSNEYSKLIFFKTGLVRSLCCPKDSHESSPAPQFKSINSSVLCLLYCPTLTSIYD